MKEKIDIELQNQDSLLKCEVCGKKLKSITNSHLRTKHNMTTDEYKSIYPNSKMISDNHNQKLDNWRKSDKNRLNCFEMNKIISKCEKRKDSCRKATQSISYRKNHSEVMKNYVRNHPESVVWKSIRGADHHHYGKSNWQRWFEKHGKDIADQKLLEWKEKNRIPGTSRDTKIEKYVKSILEKYNITYIHQYHRVDKFYIDFFIPTANLALEVHGDYWHANPRKYKADDVIKYPGNRKLKASYVWERDKRRVETIKSFGYSVVELFESDISEETVVGILNDFLL
jgi:G:T-mismatch repair DNA endonuclease (very short patch repair protein)